MVGGSVEYGRKNFAKSVVESDVVRGIGGSDDDWDDGLREFDSKVRIGE